MISIIIPAYNEKSSISQVIDQVIKLPVDKQVLIIDDGSGDGTTQILKDGSYPDFVKVIHFGRNRGKGMAVRTGIAHSQGEYVVIQDADLEIAPSEILRALKVVETEKADIVYGSRFLNRTNSIPLVIQLGNKLLTRLFNLAFGSNLTDVETPTKLFRRELIASVSLNSHGFEFEIEATAKLLKKRYKIREIAVSYKPRSRKEGKKIRFVDGLIALLTIVKQKL